MEHKKPEFLTRLVVFIILPFIGAALGYGIRLLIFKPIDTNARIHGLGAFLISLTLQLPVILGGLAGALIGFLVAIWPDKKPFNLPISSLKHLPSREETRQKPTLEVGQPQTPFASVGFETYKTKLRRHFK